MTYPGKTKMKYDKELTDKIIAQYEAGMTAKEIATAITEQNMVLANEVEPSALSLVPERSIIAKLSSLGIYKKKGYRTKRGEIPIKKEEYIDRIAALLDVQADFLESLEKVNKGVLALIATKLTPQE